jgi:hypothetical protein
MTPSRTHPRRRLAPSLYRTAGYESVERYNLNPHADHWSQKNLTEHNGRYRPARVSKAWKVRLEAPGLRCGPARPPIRGRDWSDRP